MLLLLLRPWFRRRGHTFRLRTLARRRSQRTLSRLSPIRLRPVVWLGYRRTIGLGLSFRLRGRRSVRFDLIAGSRAIRATSVVLWMRRWCIDQWLSRSAIDWSVVWRSGLFRVHNGAVAECSGLRSGSDCRRAMVHGGTLLRIRTCLFRMLRLNGYRRYVFLMRH